MPVIPEPQIENERIIDLRGVHRHFRSGKETIRAIDDVDLSVQRKEFMAITGASGSGKTTLLNLMGLLDSPTSGTILIKGMDANTLNQREKSGIRLREIGFIFQFFNLQNNLTALENVMIPCWLAGKTRKESERRAAELLEKVGIGNRATHLPSELSGGQQQRVAIARAMVNSPSVILADEPTGNLDSQTTSEIIRLFEELNEEGQAIVMVTHERDLTERSHRTIKLTDGKIVSDTIV